MKNNRDIQSFIMIDNKKKTKEGEIKMERDLRVKTKELSKNKGITLIALVITILFSYDEKLKCSNSKGFLLATI